MILTSAETGKTFNLFFDSVTGGGRIIGNGEEIKSYYANTSFLPVELYTKDNKIIKLESHQFTEKEITHYRYETQKKFRRIK